MRFLLSSTLSINFGKFLGTGLNSLSWVELWSNWPNWFNYVIVHVIAHKTLIVFEWKVAVSLASNIRYLSVSIYNLLAITSKFKMAELHMYQQDMVSKDISSYVLIITKPKKKIFFDRTTVK